MTRRRFGRRHLLGGAVVAAGGLAAPRGAEALVDPDALLLHLLPTAVRVYDSRPDKAPSGTDPATGATDVKWVNNTVRQIDVELVLGQAALGETGVPNTAPGVLMNITVVNINAGGYLVAWSPLAARPVAANVNWSATSGVVNTPVTSRCADGYVSIGVFGAGSVAVDLVIDVVGWYAPAA